MTLGKPATAGHLPIWDGTKWTEALPSNLNISGQQKGDIIYFNGTTWVRLPAGTNGQLLQTAGAGANPSWQNPSFSLPSRVTPLDGYHIHAWELTDASGSTSFVDSGLVISGGNTIANPNRLNIPITSSANLVFGSKGIVGDCVYNPFSSAMTANITTATFTDLPTSAMTIECWARILSLTSNSVEICAFEYGTEGSSSASQELVINTNGTIDVTWQTSGEGWVYYHGIGSPFSNTAQFNEWNYYAITYDSSTHVFAVYVNGYAITTATRTGNIVYQNSGVPYFSMLSGKYGSPTPLIGQASRLRISNIARPASYIQSVYKTGKYF